MAKKDDVTNDVTVETVESVSEKMIPESQVADLVRAELQKIMQAQNNQYDDEATDDEKQKVRMSRFDEKWVVDYVDKNNDPYVAKKIFDFDKRNESTGVVEKHVTLKFVDGSEKDVPFISYLRNRNQVLVDVEERMEKKVQSKIGTVTIKEIRGENTFDTGRRVDQTVSGTQTMFKVNLNESGTIVVPSYVVN